MQPHRGHQFQVDYKRLMKMRRQIVGIQSFRLDCDRGVTKHQDDEGMTKPLEKQNPTEIKTEIVTKIKTNPVYVGLQTMIVADHERQSCGETETMNE